MVCAGNVIVESVPDLPTVIAANVGELPVPKLCGNDNVMLPLAAAVPPFINTWFAVPATVNVPVLVTVTAPVVAFTLIPVPALTLVTFASVYVVEMEEPFQVPLLIVPTVVIDELPATGENADA